MAENNSKGHSLFREKSLEAVESPESLNDYMQVTSPAVWLVLAAVIALLAGAVLWGIFGRINTWQNVAVVSDGTDCTCVLPYDSLEAIMDADTVSVEGTDYPLRLDLECETVIVSESMSPYVRVTGGLALGDVAVEIPVEASLPVGVYTGSVLTESLQPLSLLLQ